MANVPTTGAGPMIGVWLAAYDMGSDVKQTGRLLALQRMEFQRLSVTGVIHDLNNSPTGLADALELLRGGQEPSHQLLGALKGMVRRPRDIISRLLEVSRPADQEDEPMDLRTPLRQAADLMRHRLGPGVSIVTHLPRGQVPVKPARTNLLQYFFNLGSDARDAMDGHGAIEVDPQIVEDPVRCEKLDGSGPRFARITFTDTGPGVPQAKVDENWDPFFTAKERSDTGIAVVRRAVVDHDGTVVLHQEEGKGARVEICFPMHVGLVDDDEPTRTLNVPRHLTVTAPPGERATSSWQMTSRLYDSFSPPASL